MYKISEEVKKTFPEIHFGTMTVGNLTNTVTEDTFQRLKKDEIVKLKAVHEGYERSEFIKTNPAVFYRDYYKKFHKTYHLILQLESILKKDREVPEAGAFVEAMFIAEMKDFILTAGHNLEAVTFPLKLDMAKGGEEFMGISGINQVLTQGDLYLADEMGIISSVLNGPDYRTRIQENTKEVMYFAYGVQGITGQLLQKHLHQIGEYLEVYAPSVEYDTIQIWG
jgi:Uncharacterized conserved protein